MEIQKVSQKSTTMDASVSSCNGGIMQHSDMVEDNENLSVNLLNDLDSYWEDIEDRLTVSRVVSDSVVRGVICAVEQEAVEKIAQKELKLARLKEMVHLRHVGADVNESYSMMGHEPKSRKYGHYLNCSNAIVEHDRLQDSLGNLKVVAIGQFQKLKKEIDEIKGLSSITSEINKIKGPSSSTSKNVKGLSDILEEKKPDKWIGVDRTLDGLRTTLDSIYMQAEDVVCLSKSLLPDWQQEREFQAEIEAMVIKNSIQSLQEDFEQRLWDQNARSYGNENTNWFEKIKEISRLRQELDAISKVLSVPESGQLISHGSLEHRKASGNHASSASLWEGNGKHDESMMVVPENLDHAQLKRLSKDALFGYLKTEMTNMKRQYEIKEREMTEKNFSLKREYLKLKNGASLSPVLKDKEFDTLRKKIPEFIVKLDGILMENEKLPSFYNNAVCLDNMKDRLESLHSENHQLKNLLMDKEKEISCLSSKVSDAAKKILEQSLAEQNLSRMLEDLKCLMEDAQVEASICEDIHKFLLEEAVDQMKGFGEELNMEYDIMQGFYEIIFKEAHNSEPIGKLENEDSFMESILMQGICEVIFRESFQEAKEKVDALNLKYTNELEIQALEKEKALRSNIAEKEKLEEDIIILRETIDEKNNLVQEAAEALAKEKEKFESTSEELNKLRDETTQQQMLILKCSEELQVVKVDLVKALETIEMDKGEIFKLREQLEVVKKKLREVVEEKSVLFSISQEYQNTLSLVEATEREHRKQMNATTVIVQKLSKAVTDFECRATEDIKLKSLRMESMSSQLHSLIQNASKLRRTGFLYKQRLERMCSDLQKAEAEVDLLGDEVDALLSLLEKIYIALDHYSPILQHYPGIMEILKLVRRELSGESVKPV